MRITEQLSWAAERANETVTKALAPLADLETKSLFGGAALKGTTFDVESLGLGNQKFHFIYKLILFPPI